MQKFQTLIALTGLRKLSRHEAERTLDYEAAFMPASASVSYTHLQSSTIDLPAHVESLLQCLGATTSDSGGRVTYYGSDPITPDRLPYGSISAISLAAKAILIAKISVSYTHLDVYKRQGLYPT